MIRGAKEDEVETPDELFDKINAEFQFTVDMAANANNKKCVCYVDSSIDGVTTKWLPDDVVWCHPPISRAESFARRASQEKCVSVLLVPAKFDSNWWNDYVVPRASHIILLKKRIRWKSGSYAWEGYALVIFNQPKLPPSLRTLGMVLSLPSTTP